MPQPHAKNRADVVATVRSTLRKLVDATEGLEFDELDWQILEIAAEACACSLILDQVLRRGVALTPRQVEAYDSVLKMQEACFRALGVENPYAQREQTGASA